MATVLVVDDSASVRKVIERALEARKIRVLSAALGSEAIERIEREEPDLVVADVILPDKDGYQVCEFVKTHPRLGSTPVLLISGIVNDSVLDRAAKVGSNEVVRKPFTADELARKIEDILANGIGRAPAAVAAAPRDPATAVAAPVAEAFAAPVIPAPTLRDQIEAPTPPLTTPAKPAAEPGEIGPETGVIAPGASLKKQLDQLAAVAGVRLAVLANREGFLIESSGEIGVETEVTGALASCLAEASDGLGRELGQGSLHGIILEYDRGMLLLHGVGSGALLAILLRDAAALGKVRYYVKKTLPELARAL